MGGRCVLPCGLDFHGAEAAEDAGQPWTATTWTLNSLREWGLDPAVLRKRRTAELLAENSRWEYDNLPYWGGEVDCCINAWTVANGLWRFEVDAPAGEPSKWLTLFGTRVLAWWDSQTP